MSVNTKTDVARIYEIKDTLLAISIVSKKLAKKLSQFEKVQIYERRNLRRGNKSDKHSKSGQCKTL